MEVRVQFPEPSAGRLKALMARDNLTEAELLSASLRLYEWMSNQAEAGKKFYVQEVGGDPVELKLFEAA